MRMRRMASKNESPPRLTRRRLLAGFATLLGAATAVGLLPQPAPAAAVAPLRIGIIGSGHIGGTLAKLWVQAGDEVLLSSRNPDELKALAQSLGPHARVGTPAEAARYGQAVLLAVPYPALKDVAQEVGSALRGKVVLDATNPYPPGSAAAIEVAAAGGTGVTTPRSLPGAVVVRAFSTLPYAILQQNAQRSGAPLAIPIAGDNPRALRIARRLVHDAGFEAVVVGGLAAAKRFDVGSALNKPYTPAELRTAFGLPAE
jgi:8-hydroxy-5-deazaflavin:NADPH oxidoreductase